MTTTAFLSPTPLTRLPHSILSNIRPIHSQTLPSHPHTTLCRCPYPHPIPNPPAIIRSIPARPSSTHARSLAISLAPATIMDRLQFYLAEYLMWHPGAKVLSLFAITLICMYLGSFMYRIADPSKSEAKHPFWHSVRAIANPLEDDWDKNSLRATSIILASVGMVVFAILVGMVTESVESAVNNVDGRFSRVVIKDHLLVCGWSPNVSQMLSDVNKLNSRTKVVILATADQKTPMLQEIRARLSEEQRGSLKVFYRPGAPIIEEDLKRVAAESARKIILVNPRTADRVDSDRVILSRALALRHNLPQFKGDIVAELNSVRDEGILRSILKDTNARSVETVNADQLLFRFMAQAIRQPGLADVVAQLMGANPRTVFNVARVADVAPPLVGTNFADVRPTSIPGTVLCGFFDKAGHVHIEPGHSYKAGGDVITKDTEVLLLGSGKSGARSNVKLPGTMTNLMRSYKSEQGKEMAENFLFCGWRQDMEYMLGELDTMLVHGSKVTILDEDVPEKMPLKLKNISVKCIKQRADRYENLEKLIGRKSKPYDQVVLLGSALGDSTEGVARLYREEDTKTLASLVYVNELLLHQQQEAGQKGKQTTVTVEFVNERVASMAREQNNIANAILPQNLAAKIAAQTVRDSRLNAVWSQLLSQAGREVYLRSAGEYGLEGERLSWGEVAEKVAEKKNDLVIGYVGKDGQMVINPDKTTRWTARPWVRGDVLIVLSED